MHCRRLIILVLAVPFLLQAQADSVRPTTFRFFAEGGIGYIYKTSDPSVVVGRYTRDGVAATVRLKWGSSNLIGIGVESGWLPISSMTSTGTPTEFGPIDASASLSAVPLLAVLSFQRYGVQMHLGAGYYRVRSQIIVMGKESGSSEWDMGFMASVGMARPVSDDVHLGAEVKMNMIAEQQITLVSANIRVLVRLFGE